MTGPRIDIPEENPVIATAVGARALADLLDNPPAWLPPTVTHWEITTPTEGDPRHVLGQLPDSRGPQARDVLLALAEQTGGEYLDAPVGRPHDGSQLMSAHVRVWHDGVLFAFWSMHSVRLTGDALAAAHTQEPDVPEVERLRSTATGLRREVEALRGAVGCVRVIARHGDMSETTRQELTDALADLDD